MKRTLLTLILAATTFIGAGAQQTERINRSITLYRADSLQLDSMYNYWNEFVQIHPKDEVAWRNLYEVYIHYEYQYLVSPKHFKTGDEFFEAQQEMRRKFDLMRRMEQAIPDSYTFNYCAHDYDYEWQKYDDPDDIPDSISHKYASRAIELLPDTAERADYEVWSWYLMNQMDTVRLTRLLTQYFNSGRYPAEDLQYHYNELQGMDEGAIYLGQHNGNITGKLILQLVKGVHRDKILYSEAAAISDTPFFHACIQRMGFSAQTADSLRYSISDSKGLERVLRYILDNAKRPVYLSSSSISMLLYGEGVPDDLKEHLYNEGLTIRYSAKPYDNLAVKRRNVEERYMMEYLRFTFHPNEKDCLHDRNLSFHYLILLQDLLPYYKKNNPERFCWLNHLFHDILAQMEADKYGFVIGSSVFNIHKVEDERGTHYEVEEGNVRPNEAFTGVYGSAPEEGLKYLTGEPIHTHVILKTEPIEVKSEGVKNRINWSQPSVHQK